ncbi:MAG: heavy-metal-associated domain-containing protein [Patescibacteria group bacterium]
MEKLEMKIEGMHCGACATGIQMITSGLDGVDSVFVDYNGKKGNWEFDPTKVKKEDIQKAIAELGYKAE